MIDGGYRRRKRCALMSARPNAEVRATYLDLADSWQTVAEHVGHLTLDATSRRPGQRSTAPRRPPIDARSHARGCDGCVCHGGGLVNLCLQDDGLTRYLAHSG